MDVIIVIWEKIDININLIYIIFFLILIIKNDIKKIDMEYSV